MALAFVLINTETEFLEDVRKTLKDLEGVKEVYSLFGVYDIIAKVEADSLNKLKEIVTWKIRRLENVRSTSTMIVMAE